MAAPVKRNSGCRSFLIFVLGMITGVIVFLGSIAGTIYVVVTSFTLKDVERTLKIDIPIENDDIMDQTLLDLGKGLYETLKGISSVSLQEIMDKYDITLPADLMGIDISVLYQYPLTEMPNHIKEVFDTITLATVGDIVDMDFSSYDLPILTNNIDQPIVQALDKIMSSFGGDMTLRSLNTNFGIDLAGSSDLLAMFMDSSIDSIGSAIDFLELGELINIDSDLFIELGETTLFVKTMRYEEVTDVAIEVEGAERYISGTTETDLVYKEMRYTLDEDGLTYKVNNDTPQEDTTYYRLFEYELYDSEVHTTATEFYVKARLNKFEFDGESFAPISSGYFLLNNLFADASGSPLSDYTTLASDTPYFVFDEATETYVELDAFGIDGVADENSRLHTDYNGWLCVYVGTSDQAMQAIATSNISELGNASSEIMALPLGQLIDIDTSATSTDPLIMQNLADTPVRDLSATVGTLTLADAVAIDDTSPKILQSLAGSQITNISDAINNLTLGESIDIYEDSHVVIRRLKDSKITEIGTEMNAVIDGLAVKELVEIQEYSVYNEVLSSSDYLLTQADALGTDFLYVVDNTKGNYYFDGVFKPIDTSYLSGNKYSKKFFAPILLNETAENTGEYVLVDGYAVEYDSEEPAHEGLPKFNLVNGYIASYFEQDDVNVKSTTLNNVVEVEQFVSLDTDYEKSSKLLVSLGDVTVENLGATFNNLTMEQMIEIEADSFFDDPAIRTATPDTLTDALGARISNATIGQLNYWGDLALNPFVLAVLRNYTVADFFAGLSWDGTQVVFVPSP